MSSLRPLEKDDLTGVASLYERVVRSGSSTPPPGLGAYLGRMVLDHPWADPELPSLVSTNREGAVEGFIGSHLRRLHFDGGPLRLRYSEWFVTDPAVRGQGMGALLLRGYLAGPQDLTITVTAEGPVRRMWETLGGMSAPLPSISWLRFFCPSQSTGVGEVVQLMAPDDDVDAVPEQLLHDAWRSGATLLRGRLEPRLFGPVARRRCHLRPSGTRVPVHARGPEVAVALALGQALLTRMEGTWWMGHPVEPFTSSTAPSPR